MALFSQSALRPPPLSTHSSQNTISNPEQGLRRVNIRQLLDAVPTAGARYFSLDGVPINKVMLVANVCQDNRQAHSGQSMACKAYALDDGSGRLAAHSYEVGGGYIFETFEYARIVGELVDEYKGSRSFKIFNMQPIYDPHEIYFHILHSIFDCLVLEKGPPPGEVVSSSLRHPCNEGHQDSLDSAFQQLSLSGNVTVRSPRRRRTLPSSRQGSLSPIPTDRSFTQMEIDIMRCLANPVFWREEGVHVQDLIDNVTVYHPSITPKELSESLEYLIEAGEISYLDDWHYRLSSASHTGALE